MSTHQSRMERMKEETAKLKLKEQRIKLRTLEYTLTLEAQRKQCMEEDKQNNRVAAIHEMTHEMLLGMIESLQNRLNHAHEELAKYRPK